jgi:hypothetical protein
MSRLHELRHPAAVDLGPRNRCRFHRRGAQTGRWLAVWLLLATVGLCLPGRAQVVFSNDFETNTDGFTASGSLTNLSRVQRPTDSGGPSSTNTSMWLGKIGDGVAKGGTNEEVVTLALTNLIAGATYTVAFDLMIGASWDGAASGYGPDCWRFSVDGQRLVDTIFSNVKQGVNAGAYSPQRYSDTNYATPTGPDVDRFTGADAFWSANADGNYANDYAIYYFGHGAGNPMLSFTATNSSATLQFVRYGSSADSSDEYWALDNVLVTGAVAPRRPTLSIERHADNVTLSWLTNALGYQLQAVAALPGQGNWLTVETNPPVVGAFFVVTNPISGTALFYRLAK